MQQTIQAYFDTLTDVTRNAAVTDKAGHEIGMERGFAIVRDLAHKAHDGDNKLIFIGNGGSQGMSSHLAANGNAGDNGCLIRSVFCRPQVQRASSPQSFTRVSRALSSDASSGPS